MQRSASALIWRPLRRPARTDVTPGSLATIPRYRVPGPALGPCSRPRQGGPNSRSPGNCYTLPLPTTGRRMIPMRHSVRRLDDAGEGCAAPPYAVLAADARSGMARRADRDRPRSVRAAAGNGRRRSAREPQPEQERSRIGDKGDDHGAGQSELAIQAISTPSAAITSASRTRMAGQ